jgi:thiol:disulfide interchange protein DsbA
MKNKILLVVIGIVLSSFSVAQAPLERYVQGLHYIEMPQHKLTPNTVLEFFSFACPHCNKLEPYVHEWVVKNKPEEVVFFRVPAAWNEYYAKLARFYYVMESLGLGSDEQLYVFNVIHKFGKPLQTERDMQQLVGKWNVPPEDFTKAWISPDIKKLLEDGAKLEQLYQISGVPTLVVNGRYLVKPTMAGGNEETFKVVDYLLQKDKEKPAAPAQAAAE